MFCATTYNGNHQFVLLHIHYFLVYCIFSKVERKTAWKYYQDTQTIIKLMRQAGRAIKYLNESFNGQDKDANFPSLFELA